MQLAGPGVWGPPRDPDDQAGRCGLCGVGVVICRLQIVVFTMLSISGSSDRRQSLVTGYAGRHEHVPVQRIVSRCDFVNNSNSFGGVLWGRRTATNAMAP
jgi:hypothetical protein